MISTALFSPSSNVNGQVKFIWGEGGKVKFWGGNTLPSALATCLDESKLVQQKCFTTKPQLGWRTRERKMALSTPLKGWATHHHHTICYRWWANKHPLDAFCSPLNGRLHLSRVDVCFEHRFVSCGWDMIRKRLVSLTSDNAFASGMVDLRFKSLGGKTKHRVANNVHHLYDISSKE